MHQPARLLLALAAAALATAATAQRRAPVQAPPRGEAALRDAMLSAHNAVRAQVRVPALVWDDRLAADARAYAGAIARTGRFAHAADTGDHGENLWMGTRGAYTYPQMTTGWVAEQRHYLHQPFPKISRTGRWTDVAHYAQIVWRGTRRVGCAVASGAAADYLVCRYDPGGNIHGEHVY